ncbi:MAG: restriction endonuclease subunit S [Candidatus Omnitrophica bacterium]|nr:restriction endonuclease subunit S [Candidatus Omnitrophota bacterium]
MTDWKECKLGDVISSNNRSVGRDYKFNVIKYLDTGSITCGKIDGYQELELIDAPSRAKRLVKHDDIVYSTVRPIQRHYGFVAQPEENLVVSTGFVVLETNKNLADPKFIYFYLSADDIVEELDIIAEASTSTYPSLKPSDIENLDIILPSLPEQKAIAGVLSSLDDKIDLLHRQNKTLESIAETLFRQWFVEEAKEEWEDGCLEDIADINPTYQLKKGNISTYLEMGNVSSSTFNPEGWYKREFTSGMKFQNGDTLLARITPCLENGKTCFVTFLDNKEIGWGSTEYIVIRMKEQFHPYISYILAKDKDFRDFAISSMSGSSGRQRAQANVIKEYEMKMPPMKIIEKLNYQLVEIFPKLKNNANQISTLEKLRDTLLPKLMSGELKVKGN